MRDVEIIEWKKESRVLFSPSVGSTDIIGSVLGWHWKRGGQKMCSVFVRVQFKNYYFWITRNLCLQIDILLSLSHTHTHTHTHEHTAGRSSKPQAAKLTLKSLRRCPHRRTSIVVRNVFQFSDLNPLFANLGWLLPSFLWLTTYKSKLLLI